MCFEFPVPLVGFFQRWEFIATAHSFSTRWVTIGLAVAGAILVLVMLFSPIWTGTRDVPPMYRKFAFMGFGLLIISGIVYILGIYTILLLLAYFAIDLIFEYR